MYTKEQLFNTKNKNQVAMSTHKQKINIYNFYKNL